MTPLYPSTNGTAPNTWRDNLIVWAITPLLCISYAVVLGMIFIEADMKNKGR